MGDDHTSLWVGEAQDPMVIRHTEEPLPDGRTRVTFTVSRGGNDDLAGVPLGIYYTVSVADDPELTGGAGKNYENTVEWDGLEDSTHTTVTRTGVGTAKERPAGGGRKWQYHQPPALRHHCQPAGA